MIEIIETAKLALLDAIENYKDFSEAEQVIVEETLDILKRAERKLGEKFKEEPDPNDLFNKAAGIVRPKIRHDRSNMQIADWKGKGPKNDAR